MQLLYYLIENWEPSFVSFVMFEISLIPLILLRLIFAKSIKMCKMGEIEYCCRMTDFHITFCLEVICDLKLTYKSKYYINTFFVVEILDTHSKMHYCNSRASLFSPKFFYLKLSI